MENNFLKNKVESLAGIERKMDIAELHSEIEQLLLKYSSGTNVQNLNVKELKLTTHLIHDIIFNPLPYIRSNNESGVLFRCPDCAADLEWQNESNTVKFIKHNT